MALIGKIEKNFNCHNFGCVQDSVIILGSMVWFSGSAKLTEPFMFIPD